MRCVTLGAAIRGYMLRDNAFVHSSVMFGREALETVGGYDQCFPLEKDELWVRIAARCRVAVIPEALVICRVLPGSLFRRGSHSAKIWERLHGQFLVAQRLGGSPLGALYVIRLAFAYGVYRGMEMLRRRRR